MTRTLERKTWADRQSIPTGVLGEIWRGITISEANRISDYVTTENNIKLLQRQVWATYRSQGIEAVLFGVQTNNVIEYAIFLEDGILTEE